MPSSYLDYTMGPVGSGEDFTSFAAFFAAIDDGTNYVSLDQSPRLTVKPGDYSAGGGGGGVDRINEKLNFPVIANTSSSVPVIVRAEPGSRTGWTGSDCITIFHAESFGSVIGANGHCHAELFAIENTGTSANRGIVGTPSSAKFISILSDGNYDAYHAVGNDPLYVSCIARNCVGEGFRYQCDTRNCLIDTTGGLGYDTFASTTFYASVMNDVGLSGTPNYDTAAFRPDSTNNAADDGATTTPPGLNPLTTNVVSGDFVNMAAGDYELTPGSQLDGAGANLSAELGDYGVDFLGTPFDTGNWPIGPFQPVAIGGETVDPDGVSHAHTLSVPGLSISVTLTAAGLTHAHTLTEPNLSVGVELNANGLNHGHTLQSPGLSIATALTVDGLNHGHTLDVGQLQTAGALIPDSLSHQHILDAFGRPLDTKTDATPDDLSQDHTLGVPGLSVSADLIADDISHGHTLAQGALATVGQLAGATVFHAHTLGSPGLEIATDLAPADVSHGHTITSPVVGIATSVSADDLTHAHTVQSPAIALAGALAVDGLTHGHMLQEPGLALGQVNPDGLSHGHTIGIATIEGGTPALGISVQYVIKADRRTYVIRT